MSKIKIEIVKAQLGLKKGLKTETDSVHAISLIDRGIAKFQYKKDEDAYYERKEHNAKMANEALEKDAKKSEIRNKPDNDRQKAQEKEAKEAKEKQQKMTLGRREGLLKPFADIVDLSGDDFKLSVDTTKEEFAAMQKLCSDAKLAIETAEVDAQKKTEGKAAPKKAVPTGVKGSKR